MSIVELRRVLAEIGVTFTEDYVAKLVTEIDEDGSGVIEFDEFCELVVKLRKEKGCFFNAWRCG